MDDSGPDAPDPRSGTPQARADRRLQVPIPLLREVARDLAAAAEPVREAAARPAPVHSAGPASAVISGLLADVDAAMAGLATRLAAASTAIRETADDLDDTDAQAAMRFLGPGPGNLFASPPVQ